MIDNLIKAIPPVTRAHLFILLIAIILLHTKVLTRYDMYFNLNSILSGQVWRIVTSLIFFKKFDFGFVIKLIFFIQVSSSIEKTSFKRGSIDYLYFLTIGLTLIYISAIIFKIGYLGSIYQYALFYYFGRINTDRLLIINFIPVRAPYCIWLILTIQWLVGDPALNSSLLGLFIGHCLYFAFNIYPKLGLSREGDKNLFETPEYFIRAIRPIFSQEDTVRRDVEDFEEGDFEQ